MLPDDEPDPRWSLANERTFLAYLRTALAFLVSGLVVAGSYSATDAPAWLAMLGLPLIVLAAVLAFTAHGRYMSAQRAMRTGQSIPAPAMVRFLPWTVGGVAAVSLGVALLQLFLSD